MTFEKELRDLINIHGKDGESNTADFILADFMNACLNAYKDAIADRDVFEGRVTTPAGEDHPRYPHTEDQLTMCMPAELRTSRTARAVEGHSSECSSRLHTATFETRKKCDCGLAEVKRPVTETHPPFLSRDMSGTLPVPENPGRLHEWLERLSESHPVPQDIEDEDLPYGGSGIVMARERPYVVGHRSYCEIDLYENWTPCTCGRG